MATAEQRALERLQDKMSSVYSALDSLENEIAEFNVSDESKANTEKLTVDIGDVEWEFTKLQAAYAFDLLEQIGLDSERKYSLVTVEEIRLAVERILR